ERREDPRLSRRLGDGVVTEMRRDERRLPPRARQRLAHRAGDLRCREGATVAQLAKHAVTRSDGGDMIAQRIESIRLPRQRRQERDLADRQLLRLLAEV